MGTKPRCGWRDAHGRFQIRSKSMEKLWKKSIAFLLILTLVLSLANVTEAKAAQTAWKHSGDWVYYVENHGAVIGGYEGTKTKVSIPSKLDGYKVKKLSYYIFAGTKVKSVTVPSSVETIDSDAFYHSQNSCQYGYTQSYV